MADLAGNNSSGSDPGVIRPIEEESVQRIVAGQAVTDLASAVKELVDNALDAGSKGINIRLFNQGLDILEVSDDGTGVPASSRPFLAHAHATSKIRSFQDIYSTANSLGFRGEALFCLANLSEKLIVATRTAQEPIGQKMEFRHDGTLNTETVVPVPRKVGTTVAVVRLLNSLPVRRADMERRIVQHRSKLMRMMEGYAIFSVGVRINLMDVVGRKENTLLATAANSQKLEQNISSVLGSKFLSSVAPISIDLTGAMDEASPKGEWKLEGFISRAQADQGNNGAKGGQQFFSINGRPVELPKVARIIGDVWRSLGGKKKFSCILTLILPNQEFDVNLSPEKRQVLLTNEEAICQVVQAGVTEFWASQTEGQFTPCASQPTAAASAAASTSTLKPPPPKINDMESLARIQESNRRRALELHAKLPSSTNTGKDIQASTGTEEMDVDSPYGDDGNGEEEDQPAGRRAYIRRFKEEQSEQRELNARQEDVGCEYGDEKRAAQEQPPPQGESPRVRRRGGFVHDISKAKQFERSSTDKNFQIPPGIEDPDAEEDDDGAEGGPPAKRQRKEPPRGARSSPVPASAKLSMKDAAALAASFATEDDTDQSSSRRVTLPTEEQRQPSQSSAGLTSSVKSLPAPSNATTTADSGIPNHQDSETTDGDKMLWTQAQSRFNQRAQTSPEKEIDTLMKSSVSPKLAAFHTPSYPTNPSTSATNSLQALNLEQFAFGRVDSTKKARNKAEGALSKQPAVSPEDFTVTPQSNVTTHPKGVSATSERVQQKKVCEKSESEGSSESDDASSSEETSSDVVWGSYQGTENVVKMAIAERQAMQERKRKLQQAMPFEAEDGETSGSGPGKMDLAQKVSLSKEDFAGLTVLSQFNKSFVLAKDRYNNVFVMDQHAMDERFNFERLMNETVIHEQKLIAPMPLELDPSEESCVLDNMSIFEKNGFRFLYAEDKPPRHRLSLTALPHSGARDGRKAVTYGKEDVSALCAILGVGGNADDSMNGVGGGGTGTDGRGMYGNNAVRRYAGSSQVAGDDADKIITRLPKSIAMFASRACRGSIMVGTALSKKEMEKLVKQMGNLKDPWKCAHGRPTMTHVYALQPDLLQDERNAAEHMSGPTVAMSLSQEPCDMDE